MNQRRTLSQRSEFRGIPGTVDGFLVNALIHSTIKKVTNWNKFMDKMMSKILKKFVCENGDCRSKEFKIGPLISLIAVNVIIATSLAVFIDKMI